MKAKPNMDSLSDTLAESLENSDISNPSKSTIAETSGHIENESCEKVGGAKTEGDFKDDSKSEGNSEKNELVNTITKENEQKSDYGSDSKDVEESGINVSNKDSESVSVPNANSVMNSVKSSPRRLSNSSSINDGLILVATTDHPLANINKDNNLECIEMNSFKSADKKARRVHFHENEAQKPVKSSHDAHDPWLNRPMFTPEQLVESYRQACVKNSCKPIYKLIAQLEATRDLGERYDTLTLRGERLDRKHCDAFEEILKRVQFQTMDLEATDLDDDSAGAVFDMVEFYDSATRLVLAFNKSIGPRGWQACSRLIKRTPSLVHLDLRSCTISEHSMPFLGRALRVGSHLQVLHLENCGVSNKVLLILVAALKLNDPLRELYLADNRLMPSDGVQIGNLLKHNDRLQLLDLRNNHLQDAGLSHISDGLEVQDQKGWGLTTLVLWNNQLTQHSMPKLAQALASNRTLETLNLGHNNIGNEGILYLKEGLLNNRCLKRLGLQSCRLTCEAAIAIAELIADTKCLIRVDLRENDVKTAGLMALSLSLKMNQSVTRLDLDKEPKKERGVKDFMEQQASLLSDISNWLQRNREQAYCIEQELLKLDQEAVDVKLETKDTEDIAARDCEDGVAGSGLQENEVAASEECEKSASERMRDEKEELKFDLSWSESLDSPAQPPEVTISDCVAKEPSSPEAGEVASITRKRNGNRMFSVKYVPESQLLGSGASIIPVSDTVMSPTLEFPLSLDPASTPVLPVLVPTDANVDPVMSILLPVADVCETETGKLKDSVSVLQSESVGDSECVVPRTSDEQQFEKRNSDNEFAVTDTSQIHLSDTSQNDMSDTSRNSLSETSLNAVLNTSQNFSESSQKFVSETSSHVIKSCGDGLQS